MFYLADILDAVPIQSIRVLYFLCVLHRKHRGKYGMMAIWKRGDNSQHAVNVVYFSKIHHDFMVLCHLCKNKITVIQFLRDTLDFLLNKELIEGHMKSAFKCTGKFIEVKVAISKNCYARQITEVLVRQST